MSIPYYNSSSCVDGIDKLTILIENYNFSAKELNIINMQIAFIKDCFERLKNILSFGDKIKKSDNEEYEKEVNYLNLDKSSTTEYIYVLQLEKNMCEFHSKSNLIFVYSYIDECFLSKDNKLNLSGL